MNENKSLKICCLTYNLKEDTLSPEQISQLLTPHLAQSHDIYILSFQECERKTFINIFYSDKSSIEAKFKNFFSSSYYNIPSITLGGIYLIIFIKNEHKNFVSDYSNNYIKTGFFGFLGNKGAVSIKFKIYNFSFIIINCHLIPGTDKMVYRNNDLIYIYKNICENIEINGVLIFSGCFNYRVEASLGQFSNAYIKGKEMDLLEKDQIIKILENKNNEYNDNIFKKLKEGKINFLPSSKYQIGSDKIDWTNKNDYPGWTDRIFFKCYNNLNTFLDINKYDSMREISFSDHKPVYAYFNFNYKI